jgi:hypothetical protein
MALITFPTSGDTSWYDYATSLDAEVRALIATPPATVVGQKSFDSFGATDNERVTAMNAYHQAHAGGILNPVYFPARQINISVPIKLFSGLQLVGAPGPVREYTRKTTINWQGAANTSIFIFPTEGQTSQGYPSDGSPRDGNISGIMFVGGSSTDVFPKRAMTGDFAGATLWYFNIHNCGVKNMRTFWWGYGTGVTVSGVFHAQAMSESPFFFGGSENAIFVGGQSFMDNTGWGATAKAFVRSIAEKSYIGGQCMPTARGQSWQISIEGGNNMVITGIEFDSQSSDPVSGANLRISGGSRILITECSFKGGMNNPAGGSGGESNNRGFIHVTGGNGIVIQGNNFSNSGSAAPASTPLVYASSAVAAGAIKVGLNGFTGYDGVLRQASAGRILTIDPQTSVLTA